MTLKRNQKQKKKPCVSFSKVLNRATSTMCYLIKDSDYTFWKIHISLIDI